MRHARWLLAVMLAGCSGELGGGVPVDDAPDPRDDAAIVESATDDSAPSGDAVSAPEAPICGVVACEEDKTHHPRIQAAFDRHGGAAKVGEPFDNGGGIWVHAWGAGQVQDFEGGTLGPLTLAEADATADWSKSAYAVRGPIRAAWIALGGAPDLGFPKEDQHAGPGGEVQTFEKGCLGPDGSGRYDVFTVCEDPPDLKPVLDAIQTRAATSSPGTDFGVAVEWLPTGTRWGARADVARTSASSAKWFWAMAALSKNAIATVEPPALPTFKDSNNSTAGTLIDLAGGPNAVNDFTTKTLGIPITEISLCRWSFDKTRVATNCSNLLGGDNFFTPNGAVKFLKASWQRKAIGDAKGDKLLEWAKLSPRSGYGGWVGTQLPVAVRPNVRHKAGWLPTGCCSAGYPPHYNDIAIVPTPRGSYAVALSMKGGTDSKIIKTMEWSSCVIWHALAKDVADPLGACTAP
ncbi:MAG: serine hydrolase [Deltaproteobacteria bacterium]|nr:serine hydrolase [Deltaproteobacteria bacterium]